MDKALENERARLMAEDGGGRTTTPDQPGPRPVATVSSKLSQLQRAAEQARQRNAVHLPDLSDAYTLMEGRDASNPVRIEAIITELSPEALLVSGALPANIRKLLSELIERSESVTKEHRDKVHMHDMARQIATEAYGGDMAATAGDAIELQWAVACMGVSGFTFDGVPNDPPIRLVTKQGTEDGLWIGTLSDRDRELIVNATWERVEQEAEAVEPFRRTENTPASMATVGTDARTTERATDV